MENSAATVSEELLTSISADPAMVQVIPVGLCGELLWNRLPWEISCAAALPTDSAWVSTSTSVAKSCSTAADLWEKLATTPVEQIHVADGIGVEVDSGTARPLAPTRDCRPAWWETHVQSLEVARDDVVMAGLLQMVDALDESHEFSQSAGSLNGDYWHGIMHRREPDYSNSKYWYRRVGDHAIFEELAEQACSILSRNHDPECESWITRLVPQGGWDPFAFVDLCQSASRGQSESLKQSAQQIQWAEMLLLMAHCCD